MALVLTLTLDFDPGLDFDRRGGPGGVKRMGCGGKPERGPLRFQGRGLCLVSPRESNPLRTRPTTKPAVSTLEGRFHGLHSDRTSRSGCVRRLRRWCAAVRAAGYGAVGCRTSGRPGPGGDAGAVWVHPERAWRVRNLPAAEPAWPVAWRAAGRRAGSQLLLPPATGRRLTCSKVQGADRSLPSPVASLVAARGSHADVARVALPWTGQTEGRADSY
jgi:hypothetical protein